MEKHEITQPHREGGVWYDKYGVVYSADKKRLITINRSLNIDYTVIDGCEIICDQATEEFEGAISLPDSVKYIGYDQFAIDEEDIPSGVELNLSMQSKPEKTTPSRSEVMSNFKYTSVNLSKGMAVIIAEGVTTIPTKAFEPFEERVFSVKIPNSVTKIEESAFAGTSLEEIIIPDSVLEIGEAAFCSCENLKKAKLPKNLKVLSDAIFLFCGKLRALKIPDSVEEIGSRVVDECYALKSINMPLSLKSIGNMFICDSGITSLKWHKNITQEDKDRINVMLDARNWE